METNSPPIAETTMPERLELARRAYREFFAECFWSYTRDFEVSEADIPWIVRELRFSGGHRGYRVAAQLCR